MKNTLQKCVRCLEERDASFFLVVGAGGKIIYRKTCAICLEAVRAPKKAKEFIHCRPDSNPQWVFLNRIWPPTAPADHE